MNVNTNNLVPISVANQNFSKVARLVDEKGPVVILKNNVPRYVLLEFTDLENEETATDEDVLAVSKCLIAKNRNFGVQLRRIFKESRPEAKAASGWGWVAVWG